MLLQKTFYLIKTKTLVSIFFYESTFGNMKTILGIILALILVSCKKDKQEQLDGKYVFSHIVIEPNELYSKDYSSNSQLKIRQFLKYHSRILANRLFENSPLDSITKAYMGTGIEVKNQELLFTKNGAFLRALEFTVQNNLIYAKIDTPTFSGSLESFDYFNRLYKYPRPIILKTHGSFSEEIKYLRQYFITQEDDNIVFPVFGYLLLRTGIDGVDYGVTIQKEINNDYNTSFMNTSITPDTMIVIRYKAVLKKQK